MSKCDMFLKVDGTKQGPIKGESAEQGHLDEIELVGWGWGMEGNATAFASTAARTTLKELVFRKRVDSATTGLLSALRNNEVLKKAVLSVRKAGGAAPVDFLTITMENGRVVSHQVQNAVDGQPDLVEEVRIAFFKVRVEYRTQDTLTGGSKGVHTFEAEVRAA